MAISDYYQILGVTKDTSAKETNEAYRRLARKYHPDLNPGDQCTETRFKRINEAYRVVSDEQERRKYNQFATSPGHEKAGNFGGGGTTFRDDNLPDFGDIFSTLFRDSPVPSSLSGETQLSPDIESSIEISLEEAYHSCRRVIRVQTEESCPACEGRGWVGNRICTTCSGAGKKIISKLLEVKIPKGVRDGTRIRIAGQGNPSPVGNTRGDLYLVVKVLPDRVFVRKGDDLYIEISVPLTTAILGGEVKLPTFNGNLSVRIPPETQNGKVFRLIGKGMPVLGNAGYGNMFAKVKVVLPTNLTEEEKKLFERLRSLRPA